MDDLGDGDRKTARTGRRYLFSITPAVLKYITRLSVIARRTRRGNSAGVK